MKCVALLIALVAAVTQESFAATEWNVTTFTGEHDDAGTRSRLYFQIFGETDFTDSRSLDYEGSKIYPNSKDNYRIKSSDVGTPSIVRVNVIEDDGWQLNKIEVHKVGEDKLMRYTFNSWLANSLAWDAFIYGRPVDTEWSIRMHTKTVSTAKLSSLGAGLRIFGPKGDRTNQMKLKDSKVPEKELAAGQIDEFKFMDIDVGNPIFIVVWVGDEVEKWCPEKIELQKSGYDTWIVYDFRSKCLKGHESWKEKEHFIYADPSTFPAPGESSAGKLQSAGLPLSAGLGLCLMVAFM